MHLTRIRAPPEQHEAIRKRHWRTPMAEMEMTRMMRMRAGSLVSATARDRGTAAKQRGEVADRLANAFAPPAAGRDAALALVEALRKADLAPTGAAGWQDVPISLLPAR